MPRRRAQVAKVRMAPFPIRLLGTRIYEISAERVPAAQPRPEALPLVLRLKTSETTGEDVFGLLLEFESRFPTAEDFDIAIAVKLEGAFSSSKDGERLGGADQEKFKRVDAVAVLWPYLREQVSSLTSRLGLVGVPPLPLIDARLLLEEAAQGESPKRRKAKARQSSDVTRATK